MDDLFRGRDIAFFIKNGARGAETGAEELVILPGGKGVVGETDASLGGFGDVAIEGRD